MSIVWIMRLLPVFFMLCVLGTLCPSGTAMAAKPIEADRNAAVILAYHRIGEDVYPANNITIDQFKAHLSELKDGGYTVIPLSRAVQAFRLGEPLPDRAVVITFHGGYTSALQNAMPLLLDRDIPFTVFFAPDQVSSANPQYIGWDDIRRLARASEVTLGLHPASYTRLTGQPAPEIRRQVNNAISLTRRELKKTPAYFAYPFGEYSRTFRTIVSESGFDAALSQQSGAAYSGSDLFALPGFAMTESYAGEDRFNMVASALPLPVRDVTPGDPHITADKNPPAFGFTLDDSLAKQASTLSCFLSEQGKPNIQVVGKNRVELRAPAAFTEERVRMNCTLPGPTPSNDDGPRWRWFGVLLSVDIESHIPETGTAGDFSSGTSGPFPN